MAHDGLRRRLEELLSLADVKIDGDRPWDLHVHDDRLYARVLAHGRLGLGESYMDGWWDCEQLDELVRRLLDAELDEQVRPRRDLLHLIRATLTSLRGPVDAFHIGRHHYDIGNDLYRSMLDERMIYSCGYWREATTLDEAQEAKLDLVCRKLGLRRGMRVLDIGCGWGGTARYAAERYGASVVGITVSGEQVKLSRELCAGLDVHIRYQDYRELDQGRDGTFDRVLSLGMFEHVGCKNYRTFMQTVRRHLKEKGLFLLHTIGGLHSASRTDPWIDRYIFPNSMLPSARQIATSVEGLFVMEDWHSFGPDYDRTLMCWHRNFEEAWPVLKDRYDERFHRMWRYYLLGFAGSFRARRNQLWQVVLSPRGVPGGYVAPR
jgi:cyclopropane-fatty-acyl-phospholipid synthase